MCFWRRNRKETKLSRQQLRKLRRDTAKLEQKVRRKAERTLNDPRIPQWIRDVTLYVTVNAVLYHCAA